MEATLSGDRSAGRHHCYFVEGSSHPVNPAPARVKSGLSVNLGKTVHPTLVIPQDPTPHHLLAWLRLFQHLLHPSDLVWFSL